MAGAKHLVLVALFALLAASVRADAFIPEHHREGLNRVFNEFNTLLDYRSVELGKPGLVSIPAYFAAPTPEAKGVVLAAIAQVIAADYSRFAANDVIQRDRVWDSVGIPPALAYAMGAIDQSGQFATTGVVAGQGIANISMALAKYLVGSAYLGQFQIFSPLVFYSLGNNQFRVWCRVHTIVERLALTATGPKPVRVNYFGEKVHDYVYTQGRYILKVLENGMRHTFVSVPALNNLTVAPGTGALYEDHSTVVAPILPADIYDWETLSA